jgi:D-threo-aldose 1-dehydrogenase
METVALSPTLASTRIGFGCAGLMREPSRSGRQRVLATALEEGITHFDVARMYGLGAAEGEVGRFAQGRREHVVIATKFGIEAASAPGRLARIQAPARKLVTRYPRLREYVKRRSDAFHQPHRYDVATARRSLETSLRELRTDYVDLLFLHDPAPHDAVDLPEMCAYLEDARRAGQIRAWGVSGEQNPCISMSRSMPEGAILQVRDDIFARAPVLADTATPTVTFGVLADPLRRILTYLSASSDRRRQWSQTIGADCTSTEVLASLLLRDALRANDAGAVLISTTQPQRLRGLDALVRSVSSDDPTLEGFRRQVNGELALA